MSDLISRSELTESIKRQYCTGCDNYNGSRCRACHADDMLSLVDDTADAQRWISVEDRLPDTRDWVLVIGEFVPEGGWFIPQIAEYFLDSWRLDVDECSSPEDRGIRVTHWMPLPEPPKEST